MDITDAVLILSNSRYDRSQVPESSWPDGSPVSNWSKAVAALTIRQRATGCTSSQDRGTLIVRIVEPAGQSISAAHYEQLAIPVAAHA